MAKAKGSARLAIGLLAALAASAAVPAVRGQAGQREPEGTWRFAVSGDSRNCGDVVMPAIAAGVRAASASFYWHLGDFRKVYDFDEDMVKEQQRSGRTMTIRDYYRTVWDDFIRNQIAPFGDVPVMLAIGNHDALAPKTRDDYLVQFADWVSSPALRAQRLRDDPADHLLKTYFHVVERGVDFITLDNGTTDQFDTAQLAWIRRAIARDVADPAVRTIVVGMHRALPDSLSGDHGMNESPALEQSGRIVYRLLLDAREKGGKRVYVVASHSHYFMDGIFNTEAWRTGGGVLPGWIVGTAGAVRYALPARAADASDARTNVYGYLLGTVSPDREVRFTFQPVQVADVPAAVSARYGDEFVRWCFEQNTNVKQ
jgi:hypothetical protein